MSLLDNASTLRTGRLPHLMAYLWDKFLEDALAKIQERKKAGKPTRELGEAMQIVPATAFRQFCEDFLAEHRAVENHFVDSNIGFRLSNNDLIALSPGIDLGGTMQESHAIAVTHGNSQTGLEGVIESDSIQV